MHAHILNREPAAEAALGGRVVGLLFRCGLDAQPLPHESHKPQLAVGLAGEARRQVMRASVMRMFQPRGLGQNRPQVILQDEARGREFVSLITPRGEAQVRRGEAAAQTAVNDAARADLPHRGGQAATQRSGVPRHSVRLHRLQGPDIHVRIQLAGHDPQRPPLSLV